MAGDEVYGADPTLRATVRELGLGYVLQVAANRRVPTHAGLMRVDAIAALPDDASWQTLLVRAGRKGHRDYAWAWVEILPEHSDSDTTPGSTICSSAATTPPASWPTCAAARRDPSSLAELVRVAGQRWRIEESFQSAKGLTGLDQHQVRRWTSWHRWTTLAMLAHAFLAVATAIERDHAPAADGHDRADRQRVPPPVRRLLLAANDTPSTPCWPGHAGADDTKPEPATCHYRRHEQQQ